jgi:hypothetical protein
MLMKQIHPFIAALVVGLFAFGAANNLAAQSTQNGLFKVVKIQGKGRYMAVGGTWQTLKLGQILQPGTIIQTASDSYVDLVLNNRNAAEHASAASPDVMVYQPKAQQDAIRLFENTVLSIDKLTITQTGADTVTETQLDLKAGRIFGTVKKLSPASVYRVKIPNGVAGIRGTIYLISADGMLSVVSGSVVIAYVGADGSAQTQIVGAGQQFDIHGGSVTEIPDSTLRSLIGVAGNFNLGPDDLLPVDFVDDQTVLFVSPIHGKGHHGHGKPD